MPVFLRAAMLLFIVASTALAQTVSLPETPLVNRANAWKPGKPVPKELLRYRNSFDAPSSAVPDNPPPGGADTFLLFAELTNYALLREILTTPCDPRVFEMAVNRALLVAGPTRVYGDLSAAYQTHPKLLSQPRHAALNARATHRQVMAGKLYASDADLPPAPAAAAFQQAAADLRSGLNFEQAAEKCMRAHAADDDGFSRIGDAGQLILETPGLTDGLHSASVPPAHARRLLAARPGDTFVIHDPKARQTVFYWVREVYLPPDHSKHPH